MLGVPCSVAYVTNSPHRLAGGMDPTCRPGGFPVGQSAEHRLFRLGTLRCPQVGFSKAARVSGEESAGLLPTGWIPGSTGVREIWAPAAALHAESELISSPQPTPPLPQPHFMPPGPKPSRLLSKWDPASHLWIFPSDSPTRSATCHLLAVLLSKMIKKNLLCLDNSSSALFALVGICTGLGLHHYFTGALIKRKASLKGCLPFSFAVVIYYTELTIF